MTLYPAMAMRTDVASMCRAIQSNLRDQREEIEKERRRLDLALSTNPHRIRNLKGALSVKQWKEASSCEIHDRRRWFVLMRQARTYRSLGSSMRYKSADGKTKYTYTYIERAVTMELEDRAVAIREIYRLWTLQRYPLGALPIEVIDTIAYWLRQFSGVEHHMVKIQRRCGYHNKW